MEPKVIYPQLPGLTMPVRERVTFQKRIDDLAAMERSGQLWTAANAEIFNRLSHLFGTYGDFQDKEQAIRDHINKFGYNPVTPVFARSPGTPNPGGQSRGDLLGPMVSASAPPPAPNPKMGPSLIDAKIEPKRESLAFEQAPLERAEEPVGGIFPEQRELAREEKDKGKSKSKQKRRFSSPAPPGRRSARIATLDSTSSSAPSTSKSKTSGSGVYLSRDYKSMENDLRKYVGLIRAGNTSTELRKKAKALLDHLYSKKRISAKLYQDITLIII